MFALVVACAVGILLGAGFMTLLYERNVIGVQRRASNVRRISQLDVFELPEKLRASIPPQRRSPSPVPEEFDPKKRPPL